MEKLPQKFIYPVILVMLFDFAFTFLGQSKGYWLNYSKVNEGSPLGFSLLSSHPLYFLLFCLFYLLLVIILMKKLPAFLASVFGLSLFLGHVWGSSSWLPRLFYKLGLYNPNNIFSHWYFSVGYFIFISLISVLIISKKDKLKKSHESKNIKKN